MAITDSVITAEEIAQNHVRSARDDYIGVSAQEVKAVFDKLPTKICEKHNALIDELSGANGAAGVGARGATVQDELTRLSADKADKSELAAKADISRVDESLASANRYTDKKVVDIGAGDMAKAVYDKNNRGYADKAEFSERAENGFFTLVHTKTGAAHSLMGELPNDGIVTLRFKATSDFTEGDSFSINGENYAAKPTGEETALPDKLFTVGDIVTAEADVFEKKLNFKLGGGGGGLSKEWQDKRTGKAIGAIEKNEPVIYRSGADIPDMQFRELTSDIPQPIAYNVTRVRFSGDGKIMAVQTDKTAYTLYKTDLVNNTYTKLPAVVGLATSEGADFCLSEDGSCIFVINKSGLTYTWMWFTTDDFITYTKQPNLASWRHYGENYVHGGWVSCFDMNDNLYVGNETMKSSTAFEAHSAIYKYDKDTKTMTQLGTLQNVFSTSIYIKNSYDIDRTGRYICQDVTDRVNFLGYYYGTINSDKTGTKFISSASVRTHSTLKFLNNSRYLLAPTTGGGVSYTVHRINADDTLTATEQVFQGVSTPDSENRKGCWQDPTERYMTFIGTGNYCSLYDMSTMPFTEVGKLTIKLLEQNTAYGCTLLAAQNDLGTSLALYTVDEQSKIERLTKKGVNLLGGRLAYGLEGVGVSLNNASSGEDCKVNLFKPMNDAMIE